MFSRVKESRQGEYLQIVENYRDGGRVRQRLILYVGHYASVDEALGQIPQDRQRLRSAATRAVSASAAEGLRDQADALDERLRALRELVKVHPDLVERDRARAMRRPEQVVARNRARRALRDRERQEAAERSDQQQGLREHHEQQRYWITYPFRVGYDGSHSKPVFPVFLSREAAQAYGGPGGGLGESKPEFEIFEFDGPKLAAALRGARLGTNHIAIWDSVDLRSKPKEIVGRRIFVERLKRDNT